MTQKSSQVDDETRARVQAFYEEYPYPFIDRVEYDRGLISRLCYLAHSCLVRVDGGRALKILIAGAGTREAVMWALSAPEHEIVAIDISERSLERTQVLAEQFKIDNLTTMHRSIESMSEYNGHFDLISSYGVLHHLPDPEVGLAALKAIPKPSGIMALMVYNHSNRQKLQQAQTLIARLSPKGSPLEKREVIGLELCRFGAQRNSRMQHVFKNGLSDYDQSPQAFADAYLNPNERSYSVHEFSDYLGRHGMSLIGPAASALGACGESTRECYAAIPSVESAREDGHGRHATGSRLCGLSLSQLSEQMSVVPVKPTMRCSGRVYQIRFVPAFGLSQAN